MLRRIALLLPFLLLPAAAARAQGDQASMKVDAGVVDKPDGSEVRVSLSVTVPDGTLAIVRLLRAAARPNELPVVEHRVNVQRGGALFEMKPPQGKLVPGEYRLTAEVAEPELQPSELRRRLTPPMLRLKDEKTVKVGNRVQVGMAVNKLSRLILAQASQIQKIYPELADLLDRAWKEKLQKSEWTQWRIRPALEQGRAKLSEVATDYNVGVYLPRSASQAQGLIAELGAVVSTIEAILTGRTKDNDNLIRKIEGKEDPKAPTFVPPSIRNLHQCLYREGFGAFASLVDQLFDEVNAAYTARAGRGEGNWGGLVSGWSKELADQLKQMEEFDGSEWVVEKGDNKLRVLELMAAVKDHIDLCGRVLKGEQAEGAAQLNVRREELRQRFAIFKENMMK
jgi:hypothetical protein